jgi:dihydropteroate synthase
MGILNTTPDSFSDGSELASSTSSKFRVDIDKAFLRARTMVSDGAVIIDVGGESTRPGADRVPVQEELDRVVPVIERLNSDLDVTISIDTSSSLVMREAINAGARMVNDVRSLADPRAMDSIKNFNVALCLMHMQGGPSTMQQAPDYSDVVTEVSDFLSERVSFVISEGVARSCLVIDPGFGFGKTLEHNYNLLKNMRELRPLDVPRIIGVSRKSMIGIVTDRDVKQRLAGSIAATVIGLNSGASIVRSHDVSATIDSIKVFEMARRA